jgi:heat shock protein HslJ
MKTRILFSVAAIGCIGGWLVIQRSGDHVSQDGRSEPTAALNKSFLGITYVLQPSTGFSQVKETTVELSFTRDADGSVGMWFHAGCNHFTADVMITREGLRLTDGIKFTQMGCNRALHDQEEWLRVFMMNAPRLSVSGDHLTLTGETAILVFLDKKIADPDRPLMGRVWTASRIIDQGSRGWLSLATYPTLSFSEDGKLTIFDSCNQLQGRFVINGKQLSLTNMMAMTTHRCTDPNMLTISAHYQEVFADGTVIYQIDANTLTIERGKNGIAAYTE